MMINNISEQRRAPDMALFSAQAYAHAAEEGSGVTLKDVLGVKRGKINEPGLAPATGTGAKGVWNNEVQPVLTGGAHQPNAAGLRVLQNMEDTHRAMMERHYDPGTAERLASEGASQDFIDTGARVHMTSFAMRAAAVATGQTPYNLRTRVQSAAELYPDDYMG